jgi:hypothetical protein
MTAYWLSFANEKKFGGVIIVDVEPGDVKEDDVKWAEMARYGPISQEEKQLYFAALRKTIRMGINPGRQYSVQGMRVPGEVPEGFKNRLLGKSEAKKAERAVAGVLV